MSDLAYKQSHIVWYPTGSASLSVQASWTAVANLMEYQRPGALTIEDDSKMRITLYTMGSGRFKVQVYDLTNAQAIIENSRTVGTFAPNHQVDTSVGPIGTWPSGDARLILRYQATQASTWESVVLDVTRIP